MGMFDYIRCEAPLPDDFKGELQTKDFDCEMVTHVITSGGRLMLDRGQHEIRPLAERKFWRPEWGLDENDESLRKAHPLEWYAGCLRRVPKMEDANFHGIVRFYGHEKHVWHEYNAKFTDGQLVEIVQVTEP